MDETKATAHLPNLDIAITHKRSDDGAAEALSITLTAAPDFQSAARMLESALPMFPGALLPGPMFPGQMFPGMSAMLQGLPAPSDGGAVPLATDWMNSWMRMAMAAWAPWFALMGLSGHDLAGLPDAPDPVKTKTE